MNGNTKKWLFGMSIGVGTVAIVGTGTAWLSHFMACSATAQTTEETRKLVQPLQEAVLILTQIHKDVDAATERDAELCRSGLLTDCKVCARAGERLEACVE